MQLFRVLTLGLALLLSACTIRYSQGVVGRVVQVKQPALMNSDQGVEVGIGYFGAPAVIAFSEPIPSHEMATAVPCESGLTQIDYRGTWYAFYIAANFPEVSLRSYCVVEEQSRQEPSTPSDERE